MHCIVYLAAILLWAFPVRPQAPTPRPKPQGCDSSQFNRCTRQLAAHLGPPFQASSIWIDAPFFNDMLETKLDTGDVNNLAYLCNGLQVFYSCLGQYLPFCLSVRGLTTVKQMDPYSAYSYLGYLSMWRFMCGAGFYGLEKTGAFDCVANTMKNQYVALNALSDTYRTNVEHDPTNACTHAKTLQDSFRAVYTQYKCKDDGLANVAGWWACEGQKEYAEAEYRECAHVNSCSFAEPPHAKKAEFVRFVDGKMQVKVGPTWTQKEDGEWYLAPAKWL